MDWYWILLIVCGCLFSVYVAFCVLAARILLKQATTPVALTFEETRTRQQEIENYDFFNYDNVWKKQKFELSGVHGKIRGEVIFNELFGSSSKVVVICHGHTCNRINALKYADIFYSMGFNVVIYDHGYFGESDGEFTTLGDYERHDLCAVIDYARQIFGRNAFLGLHGESMGAATVLLTLEMRDDVNFAAADCAFSDTMSYYRELCESNRHLPSFPIVDFANLFSIRKFGYDFRRVSPVQSVANTQTPICFIHGKNDKFIFCSHSEKMYGVSKNSLSELHLIENADHAESYHVNPHMYADIISHFVEKVETATPEYSVSVV